MTALARLTTPTRTIAHPNARRREATFTRRDGTNEVIYLEGDEGPWEPHQWEVLSSTLLSAHHLTMGIGGDLLVVYIPRKLRVYHGFIRAAPGHVRAPLVADQLSKPGRRVLPAA